MLRRRPSGTLSDYVRELYPELYHSWFANFPDTSTVAGSQWQPMVDIKEEEDKFIIMADIPGVDPKDIEVNMEAGVLSIRGERESQKKDETEQYKRVEREWGSFERRFTLPEAVDSEKIKGKCKNGVLHLTIPKRKEAQEKRRKIKIEE